MSPTKPSATTPRPVPRRLRTAGIIIAVVLIAIVAIGLTQRARSNSQLRDWTDANALPVVATVQPQPLGASAALQLPGRLEASASAPIYARTSGYQIGSASCRGRWGKYVLISVVVAYCTKNNNTTL